MISSDVSQSLQSAQDELEPHFKALRGAIGALRRASKLAGQGKSEALAMHKALVKLQEAAAAFESDALAEAVDAFAALTQEALDGLAFDFARALKQTFEERGKTVTGRPPTLVIDLFVLNIDMAARKAQWFYGKEALTRPIPLSVIGIMKAYERQHKLIAGRQIESDTFLGELYKAWNELIARRARRPAGGRINIVETLGQLTLNRQSARFWNTPSRKTFKDYPRVFFVRDLVLLQGAGTILAVDGRVRNMRLGVATKSQADTPTRSIWLPSSPLDGEYYGDITFDGDAD